jgi:PqqD family protein of HPr-rel-A system
MSDLERLSSLAINHEGFAFDPSSGGSFVLNQTALLITQNLQDGMDEAAIATDLADQFDVDIESAKRDITDFVGRLRTMQLL